MFGVSDRSASNYSLEVENSFKQHFLPRLFFLPTPTEIDPYIPQRFKDAFPNVKFIGDGTHVAAQTPEQFSTNGLTFCIYKWGTTWQIIIRTSDLFFVKLSHSLQSSYLLALVITPDGRVVMRSSVFGGKAGEVPHMLNDSIIVSHLQGEYLSVLIGIV